MSPVDNTDYDRPVAQPARTVTVLIEDRPWKVRVQRRDGYDCLTVCEHKVKGNHGWAGDQYVVAMHPDDVDWWSIVLRAEAPRMLRGVVIDGWPRARSRPIVGHDVSLHVGRYATEEQAAKRTPPFVCEFLPGAQCWPGGSSALQSDVVLFGDWDSRSAEAELLGSALEKHGQDVFFSSFGVFERLAQIGGVWAKDVPPPLTQCATCGGRGCVPVSR